MMQREDNASLISQIQENVLFGLLGAGEERTNKAAEKTSENLQPAVWMSECASSCIRQLRMIDLLGKIMSILYPIRMFHSGAPLLRKKKKKLRRTAGENLCLCSLRLGAICFSPRTSKSPAQSEESAVVFNDGRWNAGNVKMPRVADQSSVRRQNCSQITRLHRRGGTAPSSCTAEEPRGD